MRCKICLKTFRSPPPQMRKNQICTNCQNKAKKSQTDKSSEIRNKLDSNKIRYNVKNYQKIPKDENSENKIIFENNEEWIQREGVQNDKINSEIKSEIDFLEKQNEDYKQIIHSEEEEIEKLIKNEQICLEIINELQMKLTSNKSSKNKIAQIFKKINKTNYGTKLEQSEIQNLINEKNKDLIENKSILENFKIINMKHVNKYKNNLGYIHTLQKNIAETITESTVNKTVENKAEWIYEDNTTVNKNQIFTNNEDTLIKNSKIQDVNILNEVNKIILNHKREKHHNLDIKTDLTDVFLTVNSIRKVSEISNQPEDIVREYIKSPKRLPSKLKQAYDNNILSADPKLALNIAIHAVDYYNWDGENKNQKEIHELALMISQFFKTNTSYKEEFLGLKKVN